MVSEQEVICSWCDQQVATSDGQTMVVHKDYYPERTCEGSGRRVDCRVDGCILKPVSGRASGYCYLHAFMAAGGK